MTSFAEIIQAPDAPATLRLTGDWVVAHSAAIGSELKNLPTRTFNRIDAQIDQLDTAGALLLHILANQTGIDAITGLTDTQADLLELVKAPPKPEKLTEQPNSTLERGLMQIGQASAAAWQTTLDLLSFIGETVIALGKMIAEPHRLRGSSIIRHVRETGLNAIPIVALIAFLISIVLAYQGANQLQRFGAEIFTINMVAISVLREMGVLLTAIMIAGRSGSAFTAEIGVMKVNEEIDAMRIIGVDPFGFLVLPRLIALVIALPLLTFIADMMGLLGGGIISYSLLNISFDQYLDRFHAAVALKDFWVGIVKAPVFACFIALVACMRGLQVSGSAESIGKLTTISVVQSIFIVLLLDALFSILFTKLGI